MILISSPGNLPRIVRKFFSHEIPSGAGFSFALNAAMGLIANPDPAARLASMNRRRVVEIRGDMRSLQKLCDGSAVAEDVRGDPVRAGAVSPIAVPKTTDCVR